MSIYGVIADVHGNLQALTAVLAALDGAGVDKIICLGDLVGYNGGSNESVALVRARGIESIAGNHDLIALGRLGFDRCAPRPAFALRRTRKTLDGVTREFLAQLPATRTYEGRIALIHGGVDDVCEYMVGPKQIIANADRLRERFPATRVCFFGHTHAPCVFEIQGDQAIARALDDPVTLDREGLFFVNPGSVDAARRAVKLAEFALLDTERWSIAFRRVAYDDEAAERSARARGYRMGRADRVIQQVGHWLRQRVVKRLRRAAQSARSRAPFLNG